MSNSLAWFEKLRLASSMDEAAVVLAQAVGEAAQAASSGVFILDNTRENLLFFASWSGDAGARVEGKQGISTWDTEDLLCLALRNGEAVRVAPETQAAQVALSPSAAMQFKDGAPKACPLAAYPLLAEKNAAIGGVMLCLDSGMPNFDGNAKMLCAYGALLLASFERQSRDMARINSLHEDIVRLEKSRLSKESAQRPLIIGHSPAITKVREQISQAAPYDVSILLTGETGTGKELAASAIHAASPRAHAPFVKINCGALPGQLLESELFGHKKGAFSGANADHIGLLRSADGGTVLLDEIGEMPSELQVKLLRVLQEHEVRPVGDTRSYPADIRIIAATNRKLEEDVENGLFRKDLYYRLASYRIHIPALRERREDIPGLAMFFLDRFLKRHNSPEAMPPLTHMAALCAYDYPGNVRELASMMEHSVISMEPGAANIKLPLSGSDVAQNGKNMSLRECVASYEKALIESAMLCHDGNVAKAARALSVPRTSLLRKVQSSQ